MMMQLMTDDAEHRESRHCASAQTDQQMYEDWLGLRMVHVGCAAHWQCLGMLVERTPWCVLEHDREPLRE